jgi:uncharacterized membrane protein
MEYQTVREAAELWGLSARRVQFLCQKDMIPGTKRISGIWMLMGYYIAEVILYGNWLTPATSIPGNIAQLVIGLLALILVPILKRIKLPI